MAQQTRLVVIGASAGGPRALRRILRRLPADFPAPVLVVVHIGSYYSILPKILQTDCSLPVRHAEDGEAIIPGSILIAPPDRHLLLEDGMARLSKGAKENFARPAIDPLFRTAAVFYRENTIGVVLSGLLDDGTIGLQAVKAYGGVALVQDPEDAEEAAMPRSALQYVKVDGCLSAEGIADRLIRLAGAPAASVTPSDAAETIEVQSRFNLREKVSIEDLANIAVPSEFTCPECHGSLWQIKHVVPSHFLCHTGHSYSAQGLSEAQQDQIEESIWIAIRALHEKQMLMKRFAKTAEQGGRTMAAIEYNAAAKALAAHAEALRNMIVQREAELKGVPAADAGE
jgi:two-component system chemotaxis response regulator CheB